MSQCSVPVTLACPICHVADTLLEVVFSGQKIIVFAGYCPTCHSMWHSVYQRKTGDITHYPVTFYVWSPHDNDNAHDSATQDSNLQDIAQEDTSC
jgi:hypothetical protein